MIYYQPRSFSVVDIVTKTRHFKDMGFTRKRFNDEFNEIIEFVREASFQDGYNLETSLNEKCNGNYYKLRKISKQ